VLWILIILLSKKSPSYLPKHPQKARKTVKHKQDQVKYPSKLEPSKFLQFPPLKLDISPQLASNFVTASRNLFTVNIRQSSTSCSRFPSILHLPGKSFIQIDLSYFPPSLCLCIFFRIALLRKLPISEGKYLQNSGEGRGRKHGKISFPQIHPTPVISRRRQK
jgi:hypothetical protein